MLDVSHTCRKARRRVLPKLLRHPVKAEQASYYSTINSHAIDRLKTRMYVLVAFVGKMRIYTALRTD